MKRALFEYEKEVVATLVPPHSCIAQTLAALARAGATVFLVGGVVRDILLKKSSKDLDFEVHNLSLEAIIAILEQHGAVHEVGKSFGVLKFRCPGTGVDIDISLPRTDSSGRKPEVHINPAMGIEQALRRRDLTINAMAINMSTLELEDPFDGEQDLKNKVLRCPDEKLFVEDPLRFYRVMQFIGRFALHPDERLSQLCATMDLSTVSRERIEKEMHKLLLQSQRPSLGFRWMLAIGRLRELFPELAVLVNTTQSATWHPEGNVFEHTMQALDAAADICARQHTLTEKEKLIIMYAALCHDVGKATTTLVHADGKITSYRHEEVGYDVAYDFLRRFCGDKEIIKAVRKLVRYHMDPGNFLKNNARISAYKRLALKLAPETNCFFLSLIMEADKRGRNGEAQTPLAGSSQAAEAFIKKVEEAGVLLQPEPPVLTGADLLGVIEPGPKMGELVKKAYELQLNEGVTDKEVLKERVLK